MLHHCLLAPRLPIAAALSMLVGCSAAASPGAAPRRTTGYADANGVHIYYEVYGESGDKPPLVLLHGGGGTTEVFARAIPLLAHGRQVIAYDQRGHGRTADLADRPFDFEGSADDAAALLRALHLPRADVLGFSNGGTIALQLAIRHPELVRRLVVVSASFRRDGMIPGFFDGLAKGTIDDMPAVLRETYLRTAPHPDLPAFFAKSRDRMLGFTDLADAAVRGISAPTLVVVGDADVVTPEHAVALFRLVPDAALAILPRTDHAAILDRPELAAAAVAFLAEPDR